MQKDRHRVLEPDPHQFENADVMLTCSGEYSDDERDESYDEHTEDHETERRIWM